MPLSNFDRWLTTDPGDIQQQEYEYNLQQQKKGTIMREYQIDKIESYYVTASSPEEAKELVKQWDNSAAHKVTYECVWAGSQVSNA